MSREYVRGETLPCDSSDLQSINALAEHLDLHDARRRGFVDVVRVFEACELNFDEVTVLEVGRDVDVNSRDGSILVLVGGQDGPETGRNAIDLGLGVMQVGEKWAVGSGSPSSQQVRAVQQVISIRVYSDHELYLLGCVRDGRLNADFTEIYHDGV